MKKTYVSYILLISKYVINVLHMCYPIENIVKHFPKNCIEKLKIFHLAKNKMKLSKLSMGQYNKDWMISKIQF